MKHLFIFIIFCFSISANSQNVSFAGHSPELYKGKRLTIRKDLNPPYGISLYSYIENDPFKNSDYLLFNKKYEAYSDYNAVKDFVFTVLDVTPSAEEFFKGNSILKLEYSSGQICYYSYSPKFENLFVFEVIGGLELGNDFYCKSLKTDIDKFDNIKTTRSENLEGVNVYKVTQGESINYYMSLRANSSYLSLGEGVIIILDSGQKIAKPDIKVDAKVSDDGSKGYEYSAYFLIDSKEIDIMTKSRITDFKIHLFSKENLTKSNEICEQLKCLQNGTY